jgi:hypothetical protein
MTLGAGLNSGAVYNHYISKLMGTPTDELRADLDTWDSSSLGGKVAKAIFRPRYNESRLRAARDLVAARENPEGPEAEKVNWRIDAYRRQQQESTTWEFWKGAIKEARYFLPSFLDRSS